jgi:hypothetical protein
MFMGEVLNFPLGFHHHELIWAERGVKQIELHTAKATEGNDVERF